MFKNIYTNKKVLITGNTGFKGAWLSIWLQQLGADVYGISHDVPTEPSIFEVCGLSSKMTHKFIDIRNFDSLEKEIKQIQPDFIFHLAAQPIVSTSYQDPLETFSTNVLGSAHILEAVRKADVKVNVIMITSDKCYENVEWTWGYRENDQVGGKDPYSASKGAAELVIRSYYHSFFKNENSKVKLVSVRAGNVIGGGDWAANRIVPDAMRNWSENEPVVIRSPKATRPWQHVLEPLSGYLTVGMKLDQDQKLSGESFNFGPNSDQNHTVLELLQRLSQKWGNQNADEMIRVEKSDFHEAGLLKLNCDKALHELDWKPSLNFDQTIDLTASWYVDFYKNNAINVAYMENQISAYAEIAKNKEIAWACM
ncbi:MAG: CDP-glucose 4,6-dehydratase [Flavobacteriia bacterium]|jgi:CDP-glucose 4,6-dehydratase